MCVTQFSVYRNILNHLKASAKNIIAFMLYHPNYPVQYKRKEPSDSDSGVPEQQACPMTDAAHVRAGKHIADTHLKTQNLN